MKHSIALALILLVATFAVGQKTSSGETPEPFHMVLNDVLSIRLGMSREALPKTTPEREIRCSVPVKDRARCRLLIHDQLIVSGARVLSAEFMLVKNRVTNISFDLDTTHMGPKPIVLAFRKKLGEQAGNTELPVVCWQNPVSNVLLFAGGIPTVVDMSLSEGCAKYANQSSKE
jgi:hypothetical protein